MPGVKTRPSSATAPNFTAPVVRLMMCVFPTAFIARIPALFDEATFAPLPTPIFNSNGVLLTFDTRPVVCTPIPPTRELLPSTDDTLALPLPTEAPDAVVTSPPACKRTAPD